MRQPGWMKSRGMQLFIAAEGLVVAGLGFATSSPTAVVIGTLLTAWGVYGLVGKSELVTFITGDRDERQSAAFESAYRFGFLAATLWVALIAVLYGSRGEIPILAVAGTNMAGMVGLVVGYQWSLRRT